MLKTQTMSKEDVQEQDKADLDDNRETRIIIDIDMSTNATEDNNNKSEDENLESKKLDNSGEPEMVDKKKGTTPSVTEDKNNTLENENNIFESKEPEPEPTPKSFEDMEANLNEFVEAEKQKNKPKRKTVAELLLSLPGYGQILDKKPTIRPTLKSEIDFDDFKVPENDPKKKGIQDLMNRFKIHTAAVKPEKEQHFKVHIAKKEEDSQGINHIKVDEVDYVKVISTEEQQEQEDASSPHTPAPGVKMSQMKNKLMQEIRARRAKQYEEKVKAHAMYSEEKDIEDKKEQGEEEDEEEEILEDEISDESDIDETSEVDDDKEEDLDVLLDGNPEPKKKKKKSRKRLAFVEDEADESDEGNKSFDEDEDRLDRPCKDDISFIDDRPISDEEEDDDDGGGDVDVVADDADLQNNREKFDSEYNVYSTQELLLQDQKSRHDILTDPQQQQQQPASSSEEYASQDLFSEFESECRQSSQNDSQTPTLSSPIPSFLDPNKTPVVSASILNRCRESPIGPWTSIFRHPPTKNNIISPLIPRMSSDAALDAFCEDMTTTTVTNGGKTPNISAEVAKLVGTQEPSRPNIDDELEEICSTGFPSQAPDSPMESQEFECLGFGNEDDLVASKAMTTPDTNNQSKHETPKVTERNRIESKRLNFQNVVVDLVDIKSRSAPDPSASAGAVAADDDDDEDNVVVGVKSQRKRKRVLKYSDDEDSDAADEEEMDMDEDADGKSDANENSRASGEKEMDESDDYDNDNSIKEYEYDENEEVVVPRRSLVSKKTGRLRKEFVDAEAELSGDDVDSADEDERGLDELEEEAGDEEEIDEEKLRDQVGKAHLKLLLDDDQREIRQLQDMYLEQGDLYTDGKGRERQFKWKNIDNYDADEPSGNNEDGVEAIEDETEAKWQQERIDKIKWLKDHPQNESVFGGDVDSDENTQSFLENSQFLKLKTSTLRKIQSVNSWSEPCESSVQTTTSVITLSKKGSFLQRQLSSKLGDMGKINDSVAKVKNKLVFTVITPPSVNGDGSKSTDTTRKRCRKQPPKKFPKIDPNSDKSGSLTKSPSTLFKWM